MDSESYFGVALLMTVAHFIRKFGKSMQPQNRKLPRLVLHFDVNQTILMADPAQEKTLDHVLNDILANMAFGYVGESGDWTWSGELKDRFDPEFSICPGEMNYYTFIQETLADPKGALEEECFQMKTKRKRLKTSFTEKGQPGEALRPEYEKMRRKMQVSENVKNSPLAGDLHIHEFHHLLPSFFMCIQEIAKRGRDFRLIFRTFGIDLEAVQTEWNAFCNGDHPAYPELRFFAPMIRLVSMR